MESSRMRSLRLCGNEVFSLKSKLQISFTQIFLTVNVGIGVKLFDCAGIASVKNGP